jgi:hypothetical protein
MFDGQCVHQTHRHSKNHHHLDVNDVEHASATPMPTPDTGARDTGRFVGVFGAASVAYKGEEIEYFIPFLAAGAAAGGGGAGWCARRGARMRKDQKEQPNLLLSWLN